MAKLNPKKMKVAELKTELEARDIQVDKKLKKADLVAMLASALESENGDIEDEELLGEEEADASVVQESDAMTEDDSVLLAEEEKSEEVEQQSEEQPSVEEPSEVEQEEDMASAGDVSPEIALPEEAAAQEEEKMLVEDSAPEPEKAASEAQQMDAEDYEAESKTIEEKKADEEDMEVKILPANDNEPKAADNASEDITETDKTDGDVEETKKESKNDDSERKRNNSDRRDRSEGHRHDHSSRKRHHDDHDRHHRRYEDRYAPPPEEPEEEFDDTLVVLDKYNSDLNLKLHRDRLTAQPLTLEGFAYLWAGARATYGFKTGKICYECKLTEEHSIRHVPSSEPNRHLVRLGWSRNLTNRMAGEEELSYAYCGTGKKVTNKTVEDYGESFKRGDVIASYLDMSGEESVTISYALNGSSLGVAFTVEKEKLGDDALFPHVMVRNTTIEMNFGQKETPFFPHPEGFEDYVYPASVTLEERVRGTIGATARKDCEVLMMCGLPGSGKTYYVENYVKEHPEKNFSVLGVHTLMSRMKVSGLECKSNREALLQHATNCLNRLFQVACRKKRNFILDQTNVYASAQRRRMRTFEGYQRKALIIVPKHDVYKQRLDKRIKEQGRDIPDYAVIEMKANFTFPEVGDLFEEIEYLELETDEAAKQIENYRIEARKRGPPPEKRFRGGFDGGRGPNMGRGGSWGGIMGGRPPFRGGFGGSFGGSNFSGGGSGKLGNQRSGGFRDSGRGGSWNQNRNQSMGGANNRGASGAGGGQFFGGNRGGYGGNRTSGGFNKNATATSTNRTMQNRNQTNQGTRPNTQNRNQPQQQRGGGAANQGSQRSANSFNYHQAYQQQTAQFSSQNSQTSNQSMTNQQYQQQSYNQQAQQPDYSQQWAQYYQQQAAAQQQQAAAAAVQYQNYYAYQNAYANPTSSTTKSNQ